MVFDDGGKPVAIAREILQDVDSAAVNIMTRRGRRRHLGADELARRRSNATGRLAPMRSYRNRGRGGDDLYSGVAGSFGGDPALGEFVQDGDVFGLRRQGLHDIRKLLVFEEFDGLRSTVSVTWKSFAVRPSMGLPLLSRTVTVSITSCVLLLKVASPVAS